ncbi:MAG: DUF2339 domain-containing protein, partial [Chloroflexi bacterium]|nr:DUF2339 domain-containing protein [Chloroflexota bacterium]
SHSNLLLPYILLLDLGILGLVTLRPWRWMTLLGLVGSLILYGIWYTKFGDESSLLLAQSSLSGIFLVFMAATTIFHIQWRRLPEPVDLLLMSLNAATYFGISYALLWDDYRSWLGGFSIILAGLYLLLAYVAMLRSHKNEQLSLFAIGIAIVFLTIAVPVQLGSSWIAVAWAAEGAVLMWLASRLRLPQLRVFSIGVFVVLLGRLYFADAIVGQDDFRPILNDMVLAFVASIAALYIASCWLRRDKTVKETWLFPVMICAANVLTLWLVSAEIVNFIDSKIIDEQLDASTRYIRNLENVRSISLVALWALYGLGLVIMGIDKKIQWMRLGGYAVQILAVGIVLTQLNHAHAMVDRDNSTPIFNCSFAAFAISVTVLYISYYLLQKPKTEIHAEETKLLPAFVLVSNFLSLWVLSAEVVTFFGSGDAKSLSLTVLWAMYAFILIMVGITWQWRWVRLGGLVLVGVAGFKLFAIDTFTLESGYRVAAYLTLGVLLLAGGFAYQRFSNVIKRFFFE